MVCPLLTLHVRSMLRDVGLGCVRAAAVITRLSFLRVNVSLNHRLLIAVYVIIIVPKKIHKFS